jgi:hypothetical protein
MEGGMEGWRDGGAEGWRERWRDGVMRGWRESMNFSNLLSLLGDSSLVLSRGEILRFFLAESPVKIAGEEFIPESRSKSDSKLPVVGDPLILLPRGESHFSEVFRGELRITGIKLIFLSPEASES